MVLGGGRYYGTPEYYGDTVNSWTLERLRYTAELGKKTGLPVLVTSGRLHQENLSEAELMAGVLEESFNQTVTWQERSSRNTAENAKYSADLLRDEGIRKIYLVTHAFHMRRALREFNKTGLQVTPAPTSFSFSDPVLFTIGNFIPSASQLRWSSIALHEYAGILWYQIRY